VALTDRRDRVAGTLRITAGEHALSSTLWPLLKPFLKAWPDVNIELTTDNTLTDIVSDRFDAGVRLGDQIARDMVAVRIGPDWRMVVVGAPDYFAVQGKPETPTDLQQHRCINMRLPTHGGVYPWEFSRDDQQIRIRVEGQLIFNNLNARVEAAIAGLGLAYVPEDCVSEAVATGTLVKVLDAWCEPFSGYHLYYPSRKQHTAAFARLLDAVRWQP